MRVRERVCVKERERECVSVCERERERESERENVCKCCCRLFGKTWKSGTGNMAICWFRGLRADGDCAKQGCWYQVDGSRALRLNDSAVLVG